MRRGEIVQLNMQEDLALYEPATNVLKKIGEVTLYAFVAPYSSGKDSIIEWLVSHRADKFAVVIGDASRAPRKGEKNGREYHFRNTADMIDDLHNGRFVQVSPGFGGNFYATRPQQYSPDKINLKPVQARVMPTFNKLGFKQVKWLQIVPSGTDAWDNWRSARGFAPEELAEREAEAFQSYLKALSPNSGARFVLNDQIENAAGRIMRLAEGRPLPDETRAKQVAAEIFDQLKQRQT